MIGKLDRKLLTLKNRHFFVLDILVFLITPLLSIFLRLDRIATLKQYKEEIILATLIFLVILVFIDVISDMPVCMIDTSCR